MAVRKIKSLPLETSPKDTDDIIIEDASSVTKRTRVSNLAAAVLEKIKTAEFSALETVSKILTGAINELNTKIGNVANLSTDEKGTIVSAINELVTGLGGKLINTPVMKKTLASGLSAAPGSTIPVDPAAKDYDIFLIVLSAPQSTLIATKNGSVVRGVASYTSAGTQYTYMVNITDANSTAWKYGTGTSITHLSSGNHGAITTDVVTIASVIGLM